ncbi:MAG: class I SAM-dependent methyltransferase [Deltaproteobacteria bacterium]|nr:class I SAM-dependent methyltransferase [Deltaproteobacteria bacterium]
MLDWDTEYASGEYASSKNPSKLLIELLPLLPGGKALDIACGEGRNAVFLAKNGYDVDAVDISGVAIKRGRDAAAKENIRVNFIQADLENYQLPAETYDLIVNFNYLQRTLIPAIKNGLKKGGVVVFETFTLEQQAIGPPKNPEFLLKPNELLKLFSDIHIFYYREGIFEEERKKAAASLAGKRL